MASRAFKLSIFLLVAVLPVVMAGCADKSPQGTKIKQASSNSSESVPSVSENSVQLGKHVPNVALTDLNGKGVQLKQLMDPERQALPTLLMFASTDCPYCIEEFAEIQSVESKFENRLRVLTVLVNETPDSAREYLKNTQVPGATLVDPESEAAIIYNIDLVPTLLLTDSNGYVNYIGNFTSEADITKLVTRILTGEQIREARPGSG